jgi:hypothetical protein
MSKTSAKVKSSPPPDWLTRHKVIIIVAVLLVDIFITGFMKFGYNVVRCGGIPVLVAPPILGVTRHYYNTPGHYIPGGSTAEYYCTEQQAIDSGAEKDILNGA